MEIANLKVLFTSLPGRYALALFNEGKTSSCLKEIDENFKTLEVFFKNNLMLKKFLTSSIVNEKEQNICWIIIGKKLSFCSVFLSFIRTILVNKRFGFFAKIKNIYYIAYMQYKNKRALTVFSMVELLPEQKKMYRQRLADIFNGKLLITYEIDTSILGGVRILSEEMIIDATVATQLKQLTNFLKETEIKE